MDSAESRSAADIYRPRNRTRRSIQRNPAYDDSFVRNRAAGPPDCVRSRGSHRTRLPGGLLLAVTERNKSGSCSCFSERMINFMYGGKETREQNKEKEGGTKNQGRSTNEAGEPA